MTTRHHPPHGRPAAARRTGRLWRPRLDIVGSILIVLLLLYGAQQLRPVDARMAPAAPAPHAQAPEAANLMVQAPAGPVAIGATFAVTVTATQPDAPVSAYQFDLSFDPARLAYRVAVAGAFLAGPGRDVVCPPVDAAAGVVRLACASTGPGPAAINGGLLAVITFEALSAGSSDLTLGNAQLANTGRPPALLPVTLQNGQVTVGAGGPTATPTPTPTPTATATTAPSSIELLYLPLVLR